jgi:hypothetical protein
MMAETKKPNRNPVPGAQSKLQDGTTWTDYKRAADIQSCINGSRDLCAAILRTGKTHRKMDAWEQLDARRYAFGPDLVDKRTGR